MHHNFLQYVVVAILTTAIIAGGRDLRPSEHGLVHQLNASSPSQNDGARSFFSSTVTLPQAQSIGNDTWWSDDSDDGDDRPGDSRRDHVRVGLLVSAAVCGFVGVVLLIVSGIVLIGRRRKRKAEENRLSSNSSQVRQVNVK